MLFFGLLAVSAAQEGERVLEVYPIRANHKVGYVKFYPLDSTTLIIDTVIPPKYDYIGDINLPYNVVTADGAPSPYRIFELEERVGLLGPSLQPVAANDYKRIRVVTDELLAVERDSLFLLTDTSGQVYMDSLLYQDICLAERRSDTGHAHFFVKNEQGWGVRRLNGSLLVEHRYGDIRQAGTPGFYKVKKNIAGGRWRLIDSTGRQVLRDAYEDILVLGPHLIALREEAAWKLIHRPLSPDGAPRGGFTRFDAFHSRFEIVEKVNSRLAALVPQEKETSVELWDIPSQKRLIRQDARKRPSANSEPPEGRNTTYLPWYFPIEGEDKFAIYNFDFNRVGQVDYLIDSTGRIISEPYAFIEPSGKPHVFRVGKQGKWGLLADSLPLTGCDYHRLSPFQGHIAITRIGGTYGAIVITENGVDSLPCVYDNLALRAADSLTVRMGGRQIIDYSLDSLGRLAIDTIYSGLYIAENANRPLREARPAAVKAGEPYTPRTFDWGKVYVVEEPHSLLLKKSGQVKKGQGTGIEEAWSEKLPFSGKPISIREVVEDSVLVFTHRDIVFDNAFTRRLCARSVAGKAFYHRGKGGNITDYPILGMRYFDYNFPYTAFIDAEGRMGLVNPYGQQLARNGAPLRFTYIGPFRSGRARACIGGRLALYRKGAEHDVPTKFRLGYQWAFAGEFNINTIGSSPSAVQDGEVFVLSLPDNPARWVYIDTAGAVVLEPGAAHIEDFQEADSASLALILERSEDGRDVYGRPDADYGVIDEQGKVLIEPAYDDITVFPDHFSVSKRRTPVFFFNSRGHELFINRTRLRPFSEGLAHFYDENKLWGYVDSTGKVAIPPQFLKARPFAEGLAAVADTSGYCAFINKRGEMAFRTSLPAAGWPFLGNFRGGRCWFKGEGNRWGCYDRTGQVVISPAFFFEHEELNRLQAYTRDSILQTLFFLPMDFSHGVAAVRAPGGTPEPAVIDTNGQRIPLAGAYQDIQPFDASGLAVVTARETGLRGLINAEGRELMAPAYREIAPFVNGYARVQAENGRWGLFDKEGKQAAPFQYVEIDTVSEGMAAVRLNSRQAWSFIDTAGELRIRGPFDRTQPFYNGYTLVNNNGENQVINRKGELVFMKNDTLLFYSEGIFGMKEALPPVLAETEKPNAKSPPPKFYYADASGNNLFGRYFSYISPFEAGIAAVQPLSPDEEGQQRFGAINKRGVMVVPPKYGFVKRQADGNIGTNPQRFFGLADTSGNILIEADYDRIEPFGEFNLYRVERGEKIGYLMKQGNRMIWAWPLQN